MDYLMRKNEATLRFLIAVILKKRNIKFRMNYTISRGLFIYVENNTLVLNLIDLELKKLIEEDKAINKINYLEYELMGIKIKMNHEIFNSTGEVLKYRMYPLYPGIIVQFPRAELNYDIPVLSDSTIYFKTLNESLNYVINENIDYIYKLNEALRNKNVIKKYEEKFKNDIKNITNNLGEKRLILITGPSSSGKTTLAKLMEENLKNKNKSVLNLSVDDYYLDRSIINSRGIKDYETIEAFDYLALNNDLFKLLNNEEIDKRIYDFKEGKSKIISKLKITNDTVIILEGIHALNALISSNVSNSIKYKIFISPQCLISIDEINPIKISDIRLLRRIIRDKKHRNTSAKDTINMWETVRDGEYKWIYPMQETADITLNTFMPYEINVIKKQAEKALSEEIDEFSLNTSKKLLELLDLFDLVDESYVPEDSIINEFIK